MSIWSIWLGDEYISLSTWAIKSYENNRDEQIKKYICHPMDVLTCMVKFGDDEYLRKYISDPISARSYCKNIRKDIPEINKLVGKE